MCIVKTSETWKPEKKVYYFPCEISMKIVRMSIRRCVRMRRRLQTGRVIAPSLETGHGSGHGVNVDRTKCRRPLNGLNISQSDGGTRRGEPPWVRVRHRVYDSLREEQILCTNVYNIGRFYDPPSRNARQFKGNKSILIGELLYLP